MTVASTSTAIAGGPQTTPAEPSLAGARACVVAAAVLAATALVLAVLAVWTPQHAVPEDAFVCALASLAALRLSPVLRRRELQAHGGLDGSTGLANLAALAAVGEPLLAKSRRAGRPFSIVVLDFTELAEVREIYGRGIATRVLGRVVARMHELGGGCGVPLRTGKTQFTILLPGARRDAARAMVERVLGKPCRVEFDAGGSEIVLVPDIAADTIASDGETVAEVHRDLARGLARARRYEQARQDWLQRERERHSRPMPLA